MGTKQLSTALAEWDVLFHFTVRGRRACVPANPRAAAQQWHLAATAGRKVERRVTLRPMVLTRCIPVVCAVCEQDHSTDVDT